jgi:scyllo-inositol 2-dehydrogenase (NADP+)
LSTPIPVGVVGFGLAGRAFHAPVIHAVPGLELAAIVQRHGDEAARAYPDVRILRSFDELLSLGSIELVVIATPNAHHVEQARKSLEAGRDVVIDKPFAPTYAEAAELVSLAQKRGRLLSVFQNRRWDGDFKTVRELIQSDALGRVVQYESHFDRYRLQPRAGVWREQEGPGSGVFFDLGPHLIDQALVLFGEPQAVSGDIRSERDGAVVDDAFDVVLHYPRLRAYLRATVLASRPGPRFMIHGTKGTYVKYGLDPQEEALKRGERPEGADWGKEPQEAWGKLFPPEGGERTIPTQAGDYRGYYENIRDAILRKAPLAVTPEQALRVMRIIELAQQSSRERRLVAYA